MDEKYRTLVQTLTNKKKTIATMESCTGGGVANQITNIEGASEILKFSAVTYSNEYKIKMGVSKEIIDQFSVYSQETADEMSRHISEFAHSDYGVGITGKLNRVDKENPFGADNVVFISIFDRAKGICYHDQVEATLASRRENKELVLQKIVDHLQQILDENVL